MKQIYFLLFLAIFYVAEAKSDTHAKQGDVVKFSLYGSEMQAHFNKAKRVKVKKGTDIQIDRCLAWLGGASEQALLECQQTKQELNLCDWAYVRLIDKFSTTALGRTNEATLMTADMLSRSGYDVRVLWCEKSGLRMVYHSDAFVYDSPFYVISNKNYFLFGDSVQGDAEGRLLNFVNRDGKPVSFRYQGEQRFNEQLTGPITISSEKDKNFTFTYQLNKNLIDFYGDMPQFCFDQNFMTRWTAIAEHPLEKRLQDTLVRQMKEKLEGKSQKEQVQQLLWWVQSFNFEYDDKVWGHDRAFYNEETLFYPSCDSEDRSMLLSRLVRDVTGLDVVCIYYPGHIAIGVCITDEDVRGAYVVYQGRHFVICDPTYLFSEVGEEMPGMEEEKKTIELLK